MGFQWNYRLFFGLCAHSYFRRNSGAASSYSTPTVVVCAGAAQVYDDTPLGSASSHPSSNRGTVRLKMSQPQTCSMILREIGLGQERRSRSPSGLPASTPLRQVPVPLPLPRLCMQVGLALPVLYWSCFCTHQLVRVVVANTRFGVRLSFNVLTHLLTFD